MIPFKLALAIPSGPLWHADFALSVAQLCLFIQKEQVPGYKGNGLVILNKRTSLLPKSRQELIRDAIEKGCSHVLFADSDQTFPAYTAHQLAQHGKRIIGCNVATKSIPSGPTARNKSDWCGGDKVFSNGREGIEQVWRIGCGILLLDLDVFAGLPKPWFGTRYEPENDEFVGEDWFFCEQVEKAGEEIWIDHDLSVEIGHVGTYTFTHEDVEVEE